MQQFLHILKYTHNFLINILYNYAFVVSDLLKTDNHHCFFLLLKEWKHDFFGRAFGH